MGNTERAVLRIWLVVSLLALGWLFYKETSRSSLSTFKTIDAERINIRESDGTLRMVLSNKEKQDVGNVNGISIHQPGTRPAGMLFFNEHGDEMGGFIYKGVSKTDVGMSLTFDRWKNDQTVQILYADSEGSNVSGVIISDRPNDDTLVNLLRRQKEIESLQGDERKKAESVLNQDIHDKKINLGTTRVFAGVKSGLAQFVLYDSEGKMKARLSADAQGPGKMELFDQDGKVISK